MAVTKHSEVVVPLCYGESRVDGIKIFEDKVEISNDEQYLCMVYVIAEGPIASFKNVKINDEDLFVGSYQSGVIGQADISAKFNKHIQVELWNGHTDGRHISLFDTTSTKWKTDSTLNGKAAIALKIRLGGEIKDENVTLTTFVKGRLVQDIRYQTGDEVYGYTSGGGVYDSVTEPGTNPALCLYDYLTHARYGAGFTAVDLNLNSFIEAANWCDVNLIRCNGVIDQAEEYKKIIEALLLCFRASLTRLNGVVHLMLDVPAVSVEHYELEHTINKIKIEYQAQDKYFNQLEVTYNTLYEESDTASVLYPPTNDDPFILKDNKVIKEDLKLPFTNSKAEVDLLASMIVRSNMEQTEIEFETVEDGYNVSVNDVFTITLEEAGWVNKAFRVVEHTSDIFGDNPLTVKIKAREYTSEIYDEVYDGVVIPTPTKINVPNPSNLQFNFEDSKFGITGKLTWDQSLTTYETHVMYKLTAEPDTAFQRYTIVKTNEALITDLKNTYYDFYVVNRDIFNRSSEICYLRNVNCFDATVLPKVTNLQAQSDSPDFIFTWDSMLETDIKITDPKNPSTIGSGKVKDVFLGYEVEVYVRNVLALTRIVTENKFIFDYDTNTKNGISRNVTFKVSVVAKYGARSPVNTINAVNYQQQVLSGIEVFGGLSGITVKFDAPTANDHRGVLVHMSTERNFTPLDTNILADLVGSNTIHQPVVDNGVYFFKLGAYDCFGKDGIVYSAQFEASVQDVNAMLADISSDQLSIDLLNTITGKADTSVLNTTKTELEALAAQAKTQADKAVLDALAASNKATTEANRVLGLANTKTNTDIAAAKAVAVADLDAAKVILNQAIADSVVDLAPVNAKILAVEKTSVDADTATALRIDGLVTKTDTQAASITSLSNTVTNNNTATATRIDSVEATALSQAQAAETSAKTFATASVTTEKNARISADSALTTLVNTVKATADKNKADIVTVSTAYATADTALSNRIDTVTASVDTVNGKVTTEQTARASADTALSSRIDTVTATANKNKADIVIVNTALADSNTAFASSLTSMETAVKADATTKADAAKAAALVTAAADAKTKADNALAAAKTDATTKADSAESKAKIAAATDAANKAAQALVDAKSYADTKKAEAATYTNSKYNDAVTLINNKDSAQASALTSMETSVKNYADSIKSGVNILNADYAYVDPLNPPPTQQGGSGTFDWSTSAVGTGENSTRGIGAVHLKVDASGSERYTFFCINTNTPNIKIKPNNKWILSAWVYSVTGGVVQLYLRTTIPKYYPVTRSIPAGVWTRISGVVNLDGDLSTDAILRIDADGSNHELYATDFMLEVAPDATSSVPSVYTPAIGGLVTKTDAVSYTDAKYSEAVDLINTIDTAQASSLTAMETAVKADSKSKADAAEAAAKLAAAADAKTKADNALIAAKSDATTKANNAESAAKLAAAQDAANKAAQALVDAKSYADDKKTEAATYTNSKYDAAVQLINTKDLAQASALTSMEASVKTDATNKVNAASEIASSMYNLIPDAGFEKPFKDGLPLGFDLTAGSISTSLITVKSRDATDVWGLDYNGLTGEISQGAPDGTNLGKYREIRSLPISVTAGQRIGFSVYAGVHRCKVSAFIYFFDKDNAIVGNSGFGNNDNEVNGGNNLSNYKRLSSYKDVPDGAVSARGVLRKFNTDQGQESSFVFYVMPQISLWGASQTTPPTWCNTAKVDAAIVGADPVGSADAALAAAKTYSNSKYDQTVELINTKDSAQATALTTMETSVKTDSTNKANAAEDNAIAAAANITLITTGSNISAKGNTVIKTAGGTDWTMQAYSKQSFKSGAAVSGIITDGSNGSIRFMVGLNTDPEANASYNTIDYSLYPSNSSWSCYENGSNRGVVLSAAPAVGDTFSIEYDGINVRYYINGNLVRTVATAADLAFYLDSSYVSSKVSLGNLQLQSFNNLKDAEAIAIDKANDAETNAKNAAATYTNSKYDAAVSLINSKDSAQASLITSLEANVARVNTNSEQNIISDCIFNSRFTLKNNENRPSGWYAAFSNADPTTISFYSDDTCQLTSATDSQIGMASTAFRIQAGVEYTVRIKIRARVAKSSGFYCRMQEYDGELPRGKMAIGNSPNEAAVQQSTRETFSFSENAAIGTAWEEYSYTYKPTSTAKFASIVLLNWEGMGVGNALYVEYASITANVSNDYTDGKFTEATNYTNSKYNAAVELINSKDTAQATALTTMEASVKTYADSIKSGVNIFNADYAYVDPLNPPPVVESGNGTFNWSTSAVGTGENSTRGIGSVHLKTDNGANEKYVFLCSAISQPNIKIKPNNKWILSAWVYSVTGDNVQLYLKTPLKYYGFAQNLPAGVWTRISGVVNLDGDLSTDAVLRIDANNSNHEIYANDFMVEVAPDATSSVPSIYSPAVGGIITKTEATSYTDAKYSEAVNLIAGVDGRVNATWALRLAAGDKISGIGLANDGTSSAFSVLADSFKIYANGADNAVFAVENGKLIVKTAHIGVLDSSNIKAGSIDAGHLSASAITAAQANFNGATIQNASIAFAKIADNIMSNNFSLNNAGWQLTKAGALNAMGINVQGYIFGSHIKGGLVEGAVVFGNEDYIQATSKDTGSGTRYGCYSKLQYEISMTGSGSWSEYANVPMCSADYTSDGTMTIDSITICRNFYRSRTYNLGVTGTIVLDPSKIIIISNQSVGVTCNIQIEVSALNSSGGRNVLAQHVLSNITTTKQNAGVTQTFALGSGWGGNLVLTWDDVTYTDDSNNTRLSRKITSAVVTVTSMPTSISYSGNKKSIEFRVYSGFTNVYTVPAVANSVSTFVVKSK
jgi:hypothetical protein